MDYILTNGKQYIGINSKNQYFSGDKAHCKVFTERGARNALKFLPYSMKKMNFKMTPLSSEKTIHEIKARQILEKAIVHASETREVSVTSSKKVITKEEQELCPEVEAWLSKITTCNDLVSQARKRKKELIIELVNIQKKQQDVLHRIELAERVNAAAGYALYKEMKDVRCKRRNIKDELFTVELISKSNLSSFNGEDITKRVNGLKNRKYELRIQE